MAYLPLASIFIGISFLLLFMHIYATLNDSRVLKSKKIKAAVHKVVKAKKIVSRPIHFYVDISTPANNATWFVGVRYDITIHSSQPIEAAAIHFGDDAIPCPLVKRASRVHCHYLALLPGVFQIIAEVSSGLQVAKIIKTVRVRVPVGVVPTGDTFAMGVYELQNVNWFGTVARSGFNIVQSYGTGAYQQLDWQEWAKSAGLSTMSRLSWSWSNPWNISSDDVLRNLSTRGEIGWWELPALPVADDSYRNNVI